MRVLIQRVKNASCTVDGKITGAIEQGYCLFAGFCSGDTKQTLEKMASKILNLRIFSDEAGLMNLNIGQVNGSILSISQFTLYASCRKGNRPSFTGAAKADEADALYQAFNEILREKIQVETGIFQADMAISLVNDGPVTIWLDSEELGF